MNKNLLTGIGKTLPPFRSISPANLISFRAKVTKLDAPIGAGIPVAIHEKSSGVRYLVSETDSDSYITFQELDRTKSYYIVALDKDDIFQSVIFDLNWSNTSSFVYEPKLKTIGKLHQSPLKGIYSYYQKEYLEDDDLVFSGSMATQTDDNMFTWNISGTVNADVIDGYPSYLFTGGNNYIYLDSTPTLAHKTFTFECFFRYNAVTTTPQYLFTQIVSSSYRQSLFITLDGRISFKRDNVGDLVELTSLSIIPKSTWTHVALSYDGAALYLFINGKLEATVADTKGLKNITNNFGIGYQYVGCIAQPRWFTSCKYVVDFEPELKDFAKKIFKDTDDELAHYVQLQTEIDQEYGFRDIVKNVPMTNSAIVSSYNSLYINNTFVRSAVKSSDFAFTGDGCVEALVKVKSFGNYPTIFSNQESPSEWTTGSWGLTVNHQSSKSKWVLYRGNGQTTLTSSYPFIINELIHIALVREGSVLRLYYNGRLTDTFTNVTVMETKPSAYLSLGRDIYMDVFHFKFTKGSHRYSENFVPSFLENWADRESAAAQHALISLPFKDTLTNFLNSLASTTTNVALSTNASVNGTRSAAFNNSLVMSNSNFYTPSERFTIEFRFKRETSIQQPVETYLTLYQIRTTTDHLLTLSYDYTGSVYYKFEDEEEWSLLEDTEIGDFSHFVIQRTAVNTFKVLIDGSLKAELENSKATTYLELYLGNTKDGSDGMIGYVNNYFVYKNYLKFEDEYEVPFEEIVLPPEETDTTIKVQVLPFTTSALDFENDLTDQIPSTTWKANGTANVTSINRLFGTKSLQTVGLWDDLRTTSPVLTGGSTPFTVEFYALIKDSKGGANTTGGFPLFSKTYNGNYGGQGLLVNNTNYLAYNRQSASGNKEISKASLYKVFKNDLNKFTMSYDGAALRIFLNDKKALTIGTSLGFYTSSDQPYAFLSSIIPSDLTWSYNTVGIIDNINIHNNVATKVREKDAYEDNLVIDLPFDGEDNSTTIVDLANYRDKVVETYSKSYATLLHFKDGKIQDETGLAWTAIGGSPTFSNLTAISNSSINIQPSRYLKAPFSDKFDFEVNDDFTIEAFIYIPLNLPDYPDNEIPIIANGAQNVGYNGGGWNFCIFDKPDPDTNIRLEYCNTSGSALAYTFPITRLQREVWHHIAVVRDKGTTRLFVDGSFISSTELFKNIALKNPNRHPILVGTGSSVGTETQWYTNVYIDEIRVLKGVAAYKDNFSLPTELFKCEKTYSWVTNGSAKISTAQPFDSISSLLLNGTNSYISTKENFNLGSEDFTISLEFMSLSPSTVNKVRTLLRTVTSPNVSFSFYVGIESDNTLKVLIYDEDVSKSIINRASTTVIEPNVKYDISVIHTLGKISLYINGILEFSENITNPLKDVNTATPLVVGYSLGGNGDRYFNGYIKNLKIYKGVVIIPQPKINKVELDFNSGYSDKYGNITFTNQGVTLDSVNSRHGSAAYIGNSNQKLYCGVCPSFNYANQNFYMKLDVKPTEYRDYAVIVGSNDQTNTGSHISWYGAAGERYRFAIGNNSANALSCSGGSMFTNNYYQLEVYKANNTVVLTINDSVVISKPVSDTSAVFNLNGNNGTQIGYGWNNSSSSNKFVGYLDNLVSVKDYQGSLPRILPLVDLPFANSIINTGTAHFFTPSTNSATFVTKNDTTCIKFTSGQYLAYNSSVESAWNVGKYTDFYFEFEFLIESFHSGQHLMFYSNGYSYTANYGIYMSVSPTSEGITGNRFVFHVVDGVACQIRSEKEVKLNEFNKVVISRSNGVLAISLNGDQYALTPALLKFTNVNIEFAKNGFYLGYAPAYGYLSYPVYMRNLKFFSGISKLPDDYDPYTILDTKFETTGKSYLFADKTHKSIIHPVQITQREFNRGQSCVYFNGTDQFIRLGYNPLCNFDKDDFILDFVVEPTELSNYHYIFSAGLTSEVNGRCYLTITDNKKVLFGTYSGNTHSQILSTTTLTVNTVVRITVVKQSGMVFLLINNIPEASAMYTQAFNFNANNDTYLGRNGFQVKPEMFKGYFYSVRILRNTSDTALLQTDLLKQFPKPPPIDVNLELTPTTTLLLDSEGVTSGVLSTSGNTALNRTGSYTWTAERAYTVDNRGINFVTSGHIQCSSNFALTASPTFAIRTKLTVLPTDESLNSSGYGIICKFRGSDLNLQIYLNKKTGKLLIEFYNSGSYLVGKSSTITSPQLLADYGKECDIEISFNKTRLYAHVDGTLVLDTEAPADWSPTTSTLYLGGTTGSYYATPHICIRQFRLSMGAVESTPSDYS